MILHRDFTVLSPWVTLVTKTVQTPIGAQVYHSLGQADYVSVLALTCDGRVPLVRQYRPALERYTLELPGGLLDVGELAENAAARELVEETGWVAVNGVRALGCLVPDTGRLANCLWAFLAENVVPTEVYVPEPGVDVVLYSLPQLQASLLDGEFDHALHVAIIGLALVRGWLRLPQQLTSSQHIGLNCV